MFEGGLLLLSGLAVVLIVVDIGGECVLEGEERSSDSSGDNHDTGGKGYHKGQTYLE